MFTERVKQACGAPGIPFVFLGNFEVEQYWARGAVGLPRVSSASGLAVVNRMDEFALLLAGETDHVVLKARPDPGYLDYLRGLGISLARVHVPETQDPARTVTEDALADPRLLAELGALDARLAPHGVSTVEEQLAAATGLALAAPDARICEAVNSKVYSRRLTDRLGIAAPRGWAVSTLGELDAAVAEAGALLEQGQRVVVKEALGVSGKGIAVVDSVRRLDRLHRMITRSAQRAGTERIGFVIEEWLDKSRDLNYQFTVRPDGRARLDFVKEAITEAGVHKGHRMPARLSAEQTETVRASADSLAKALAEDGYTGVAGVDAILCGQRLYPVLEINARNNMSTYQVRLQELFLGPEQVGIARHYRVRPTEPVPFDRIAALLGELLYEPERGTGLLLNNFATVNAAAGDGAFEGRLYGLLIAEDEQAAEAIDAEVQARITKELVTSS